MQIVTIFILLIFSNIVLFNFYQIIVITVFVLNLVLSINILYMIIKTCLSQRTHGGLTIGSSRQYAKVIPGRTAMMVMAPLGLRGYSGSFSPCRELYTPADLVSQTKEDIIIKQCIFKLDKKRFHCSIYIVFFIQSVNKTHINSSYT